jgi:hypothetical protein
MSCERGHSADVGKPVTRRISPPTRRRPALNMSPRRLCWGVRPIQSEERRCTTTTPGCRPPTCSTSFEPHDELGLGDGAVAEVALHQRGVEGIPLLEDDPAWQEDIRRAKRLNTGNKADARATHNSMPSPVFAKHVSVPLRFSCFRPFRLVLNCPACSQLLNQSGLRLCLSTSARPSERFNKQCAKVNLEGWSAVTLRDFVHDALNHCQSFAVGPGVEAWLRGWL